MAVRLSALSTGHPLLPGRFLVLISVRGWVNLRATVWLERLGQLKNSMTSLGFEPTTFQLAAQCLTTNYTTVSPSKSYIVWNTDNMEKLHSGTHVSSSSIICMTLLQNLTCKVFWPEWIMSADHLFQDSLHLIITYIHTWRIPWPGSSTNQQLFY
jgi:hypothetical protein